MRRAARDPMSRLERALALGVATGLVGFVLSLAPSVLEIEESAGLKWLFAARGPIAPPESVAVIGISRDSAEALGVSPELDEWPRRLHAELIDRLCELEARVIVFDVIFQEPRSPDDDALLGRAIREAGNVILAERVISEPISSAHGDVFVDKRILPIAPFKSAALASAPFTLPVVPVTTSQFWTFGRGAGEIATLPVLALQAFALPQYDAFLALLLEARPQLQRRLPTTAGDLLDARSLEVVVRTLREAFREDEEIATRSRRSLAAADAAERGVLEALLSVYAGDAHRYLNYYGPAKTVRTIPYHHVIGPAAKTDLGVDLRGKVVFVGYSESRQSEQQDDFISVFSLRTGENLSGVEIGATAFGNLLERTSIRPLGAPAHFLALLGIGLVYGAALPWLPTLGMLVFGVAAAGAYGAFAAWQFASFGLWLPLAVPVFVQMPFGLFAAVLWNYKRARAQRERMEKVLGYYLPRDAVRRLTEQSIEASRDRQLLYGTCLFTDVEQYTAVSERMDPARLGDLLSDYYKVLLDVVARCGGTVSDMAADSMVAIWAATTSDVNDRARACRAALEIADAIEAFNRSRASEALPTGLGLASGQLLLGNIGAGDRYEYRAVGDIVNTAARLQGLNRLLGTRVLVSEQTLEGVEGFVARDVGRFLLRGKTEPVTVLELLAADRSAHAADEEATDLFASALSAFRAGDWAAAHDRFRAIVAKHPADGPARYYLELAKGYQAQAPSAWDGTIRMSAK